MSAPDPEDYNWTEQAAEILRDHGMTVKREARPPVGYHAFTFRMATGGIHHCARHKEEPMAFMHACFSVLHRIGHPHARTCPRFFVS